MRLLVAAAVSLVILTGCSSSSDPQADQTTPPTTTTAPRVTSAADGVPHRDEFVNKLLEIDSNLIVDVDETISDARDICLDIRQGKTTDQVTANAAARFGIDKRKAAQLVDAARTTICKP